MSILMSLHSMVIFTAKLFPRSYHNCVYQTPLAGKYFRQNARPAKFERRDTAASRAQFQFSRYEELCDKWFSRLERFIRIAATSNQSDRPTLLPVTVIIFLLNLLLI